MAFFLTRLRADPLAVRILTCLVSEIRSSTPIGQERLQPELPDWLPALGQIGDNTVVPLAGNPLLVHGTCASGAWNLCIRIPVAGTRRRIHCWVLTIGWQSTSRSSHHPFNEVRQNNTFCSHERSDSVWSVAPANAHAAVVLDLAMGAAVASSP